jgi:GNAT superfamily N-acetyltransferase
MNTENVETATQWAGPEGVSVELFEEYDQLPSTITKDDLVNFFHYSMKPFEDTPKDVARALDKALTPSGREGGYLLTAVRENRLVGGLLMLDTGMGGYVPANILLFVATTEEMRGKGIGGFLCERAIEQAEGDVKLHVEYDNPAKRLYERLGFTSDYAEMRLKR